MQRGHARFQDSIYIQVDGKLGGTIALRCFGAIMVSIYTLIYCGVAEIWSHTTNDTQQYVVLTKKANFSVNELYSFCSNRQCLQIGRWAVLWCTTGVKLLPTPMAHTITDVSMHHLMPMYMHTVNSLAIDIVLLQYVNNLPYAKNIYFFMLRSHANITFIYKLPFEILDFISFVLFLYLMISC